jgi:hypothetical protein
MAVMKAAADGGTSVIAVVWAATSPESGHFDPVETRSDIVALNDRFATLKARGSGYLEVRRAEEYPVLTLGFRGSVAVVQAFMGPDVISVLEGDGSVPGERVEVPVMGGTAEFSGQAAVNVDGAWSLVQLFLRGRHLSALGEWVDL